MAFLGLNVLSGEKTPVLYILNRGVNVPDTDFTEDMDNVFILNSEVARKPDGDDDAQKDCKSAYCENDTLNDVGGFFHMLDSGSLIWCGVREERRDIEL